MNINKIIKIIETEREEKNGLLGKATLNELIRESFVVHLKDMTKYKNDKNYEYGIIVSIIDEDSKFCSITDREIDEDEDWGIDLLALSFKENVSLNDKIKTLLYNSPKCEFLIGEGVLSRDEKYEYKIDTIYHSLTRDAELLFFPFIDQFDAQFIKA